MALLLPALDHSGLAGQVASARRNAMLERSSLPATLVLQEPRDVALAHGQDRQIIGRLADALARV